MDESKEIKNGQKTEYEKAIEQFLKENIDTKSQGKEVEQLASKSSSDKVNDLLLKYYQEKTGNDFQKELQEEMGLEVYQKLEKKLGQAADEQKEEQIRDVSKEALEGEEIDEELKKEAIKKADEKSETSQEVDFKAELMKAVYIDAFERYAHILDQYKRAQLKDESLTVGDKEGTELVLYEKYLQNIERNYQSYASSKGLEEKVLEQNEEIKQKKEKLEYDMKKLNRSNDEQIEDNIQRIRILMDRRNEIAEKMSEIAENRDNMSSANFKSTMDYYQQEYFAITVELRSQDPTLEMYYQQMEQENENREYSNREMGTNQGNMVAGDYKKNKDLTDENEEEVIDMVTDIQEAYQKSVPDLLEEAKEALESGDLDLADEILQSIEAIQTGQSISSRDADDEQTNQTDEQAKEDMEENKESEQEEKNPLFEECSAGVASEREAQLQRRLRECEEREQGNENALEKQRDDLGDGPVRTLNTNKKNW